MKKSLLISFLVWIPLLAQDAKVASLMAIAASASNGHPLEIFSLDQMISAKPTG